VHRIDKETSGILLIAKNRDAAITLTKAFADRIIKKEYIAILHGVPCDNSGVIDIAIDGKSAHTEYDVLSYNGQYSIVSFLPLTGRMHQIRVHASSLGCPIVGDKIYNNVNDDSEHMMLHAYKIYVPALFATRDQKAHDQKNCDHKMIAADISKDMKKFIELSWKNNSELKKIQKIFL
jgi:23S rRNA pseudouridine955/2504/2580 synthase